MTATTDAAPCTTYNNTATVAASDAGGGQASATITCNKTSQISLAYADSYNPRADDLPTPWVGGVTKFVGCGSTLDGTPGTPDPNSGPCQAFTDMNGVVKYMYDGGAIMSA